MTAKQRAFVDAYAGNATEAAIKAGYSEKTARSMGQQLLTKIDISNAIHEREEKRRNALIATREQRQAFWTRVMNDDAVDWKNRLRASELLGKSESDFKDRVEVQQQEAVTFRWQE